MKLILTSVAANVMNELLPHLEKSPQNLPVLFIPTAADPYVERSWMEDDRNKLQQLGFNVIENFKIPNIQKEIDIYIPDKQIGIEYNGIYWHSEIYRDSIYHINKKIEGIKNNINIINIWEDDFLLKEEFFGGTFEVK